MRSIDYGDIQSIDLYCVFLNKLFLTALISFILLNVILYAFINEYHSRVQFSDPDYYYAYQYFTDPRIYHGEFNFLRAMGTWDAQFYLSIADSGYPKVYTRNHHAFFPFYPIFLNYFNILFDNIELTAFILANILLLLNFTSIYYVISKFYSSDTAVRTIFLLFFFPVSIFYRSYYPEGLFLLLLIWFAYFLINKKWFYTTIFLSFLLITRPNGLFLIPLYIFCLFWAIRKKEITFSTILLYLLISLTRFLSGFLLMPGKWVIHFIGKKFRHLGIHLVHHCSQSLII